MTPVYFRKGGQKVTLCAIQSEDDWMYLELVPQELLGLHPVFSHQLQTLPLVVDTLRQLMVQPCNYFVHVLTERQNSDTSALCLGLYF